MTLDSVEVEQRGDEADDARSGIAEELKAWHEDLTRSTLETMRMVEDEVLQGGLSAYAMDVRQFAELGAVLMAKFRAFYDEINTISGEGAGANIMQSVREANAQYYDLAGKGKNILDALYEDVVRFKASLDLLSADEGSPAKRSEAQGLPTQKDDSSGFGNRLENL
ncbi:hypothetical protein B0A54_11916 [Friedmanniomyces endolithicus]|uniref:Uncharacterized protein n=1 Tax=Friedmanniomyces endolithicus TaxID=329885 RepID=A0A4U0ULU9_9PEZI|nr:hypothetical protein B0A54_11916 [Friedmanniomyces endolithicus]